jgi:DNA-directed RNA polymerase subunit E'/Rpb7
MKIIVYVMLCGLLFLSCKKIETLKRNNPLDGKEEANVQAGNDTTNNTIERTGLKFNSYKIYSENNNDGIINKGETVQLQISLKNNNRSTAKGVKATFSTTSSYVSGFSPTVQISYGDISANEVKWADYRGANSAYASSVSYTVEFTVSDSTPNNTQIPINISMVDGSNNTWIDSFNITVSTTGAQISYNSHSVYSDNNGDKIINKGETIRLQISLKNTGTSAANSVKTTFSTTSSYVSGFSPTIQISYGDISSNEVIWADYRSSNSPYASSVSYTVEFTVSNSTPNNTQIPISISMIDESNNTWTSSFSVTVSATSAQISYNSYSIYSDNNSDGVINKGEKIQLKISLKNTGTSAANSVKATFSTTSSYVSGFSPTTQISYGNISSNGVIWADYRSSNSSYASSISYTVEFTVSNSTPNNTQIPINISMVDESNNTWTSSFNVTVQ